MKCWPDLACFGKILSLPGGELFYYDSAASGYAAGKISTVTPTVMLIHGLGDEADTWRHIFPVLAANGYRVIAPDLPGFGRSAGKGRISISRHCETILELLSVTKAASAENPAVIAGNSMGAGIAELAAIKRPGIIQGLILISACYPSSVKTGKGIFLLTLPFIGKKWYRTFRLNHEAAWKSLYPFYSNLDAMNRADKNFLYERVVARVESLNQERGYIASLRSMVKFLIVKKRFITNNIKKFSGKILLLWGENDKIIPKESASLFRAIHPDAEFYLTAEAGHLPHQEKPAESAAVMLRFLQELANHKVAFQV